MGSPMFSCPGDFLFGLEHLDWVFPISGLDRRESVPWKAITFKCESAGDIYRLSRKKFFKAFLLFSVQLFATDLSCWQATV